MSKLEWMTFVLIVIVGVYLPLIADRLGRIQDRVREAGRPMDPDGTDRVLDTLQRIEISLDLQRIDIDRLAEKLVDELQ